MARSDFGAHLRPEDGFGDQPGVRADAGPESWRAEAERVLAEARQRAARKTQQPFSGWFR
ncbi:hypothetical protein PS467_21085 [Streptomyces luomodiensis]|uniref:Uncharacterized protein n=1 Tax=Streptomyces luomodiensis TaxID=3026192 RepID=A0ABY9VAI8_9ACTN|nr:hypothetical protein [Streptomyces sp. SCA4-21]WNF01868.1 hypothetical protein PS467_21085 [Streptomyces sp. SCA4-21]